MIFILYWRSWGGERSTLEKKDPEHRKRSAGQELDAEIDTGRVKKIRKQERDEPTRWGKENPFQVKFDILSFIQFICNIEL